MKRIKQIEILLILGILIVVGFHMKAIVQSLIREPHQMEAEKEPGKIQIHQQKWETQGVWAYLEEVYELEEAKAIMQHLEEEYGEKYGDIIYGSEVGGKNWRDFLYDVLSVSIQIGRERYVHPTFSAWLLGS